MKYIKARYLKDGNPTGREYTFGSEIEVSVGDKVSVGKATAIVTKTDVSEEEVAQFKDRLKKIDGKVNTEKDPFIFVMEANKDLNIGTSKEFTCPLCGGNAYAKRARGNGHLFATCEKCGFKVIE